MTWIIDTLPVIRSLAQQLDAEMGYPKAADSVVGQTSTVPPAWDGTGAVPFGWAVSGCDIRRRSDTSVALRYTAEIAAAAVSGGITLPADVADATADASDVVVDPIEDRPRGTRKTVDRASRTQPAPHLVLWGQSNAFRLTDAEPGASWTPSGGPSFDNLGHSGQLLATFVAGSPEGYGEEMRDYINGLTAGPVDIAWIHGEADSSLAQSDQSTADAYLATFTAMTVWLQRSCPDHSIRWQIHSLHDDLDPTAYPYQSTVRAALISFVANNPERSTYVDMNGYALGLDDVHYDSADDVARLDYIWSVSLATRHNSAPTSLETPALSFSGQLDPGTTVSLTHAVFGWPRPSVTYQWDLDASPISGATSATYAAVSGNIGGVLSCDLVLTNTYGTASVTSASDTVVSAASSWLSGVTEMLDTDPSTDVSPASGDVTSWVSDFATLTLSAGSPAPSYPHASTINSYQLIDFDGTTNESLTGTISVASTDTYCFFFVLRPRSLFINNVVTLSTASAQEVVNLQLRTNGGDLRHFRGNNGISGSGNHSYNSNIAVDTDYVIQFAWDGTASKVRVSGSGFAEGSGALAEFGSWTATTITVGSSGTGNSFDGGLGMVAYFDHASGVPANATSRNAAYQSICTRFGITP